MIKSYVSGNTNANISESINVTTLGVRHLTGDSQNNWLIGGLGADSFNAGAGDDVLADFLSAQRGLTLIGLRWCANCYRMPAARPRGNWATRQDVLEASRLKPRVSL